MTVGELIIRLSAHDRDAVVVIGKGCGPLDSVTPTANGFIILDPVKVSREI